MYNYEDAPCASALARELNALRMREVMQQPYIACIPGKYECNQRLVVALWGGTVLIYCVSLHHYEFSLGVVDRIIGVGPDCSFCTFPTQ